MEKGMKIPEWLGKGPSLPCLSFPKTRGRGFVGKNLEHIAAFLKEILEPEETAGKSGFLQGINPMARLSGILLLVIAAAILKDVASLAVFLGAVLIMAVASRIPLAILFRRVLPPLFFTVFMVMPAALNIITPGTPVLTVLTTDKFSLYISEEGVKAVATLVLRVGTMVSLASLLLLTTGYADIFRALRSFPIPKVLVTAMAFAFRYLITLIRVAEDAHMARKARSIKALSWREGHSWLASRIWFIAERSMDMAEEVYLAMAARGFTGEVKTMSVFEMRGIDYLWVGFGVFALLMAVQL